MLLVETLSSREPLNEEQWKWVARLRRESGEVDAAWPALKALAQSAPPVSASLRELLDAQYER
jgi:hypothetical protein